MTVDRQLLRQSVDELFEHAPCGYVTTASDGTIVQVNETFLNLVGCTRESLLAGKRFCDVLTVPGRIYHDTHFGPLLQLQGSIKEVAFDLSREGRVPLPILVNAVQKRDSQNKPLITLITIFDATDRRSYERELLLARRRAEEAVESERHAREIAEEAGRTKDAFLASVSHELRTPLSAILGWTQILRRKGGMTPEQMNGMSVIESNARIQSQLINDLLDISRIVAGKMRLDVQDVRLSATVEAAVDTVRPAADAKSIQISTVLDSSIMISGDPSRLQQVFWNLLINAIKFTPKRGAVRIVAQRVNSHVEVTVSDSGEGMTQAFIAHAFERFRQSDSRETQQSSGLGLGLSIVKNLVEMHGGSITATSEGLGRGSTFLINLPVAVVHHRQEDVQRVHPHAAVAEAPYEVRGITLKGVNVLIVEDEPDSREVLRHLLVSSGAEVSIATSAAEAITLLETVRPDVLVSDIGLPDEDGYALIRKVRMLGDGVGNVRAVALTAFARAEDRTQAMLAGFQMHMAKPVDARELVVTVATLAMK